MKLVKKIKNICYYLCDSEEELDECITQQFIEEMQMNNHTILGLTACDDLSNIYAKLIKNRKNKKINFKKVCTYNIEEFIELNDTKSYYTYREWMYEHFFNYINIKKKHIHFPNDFGLIEICRYDRHLWKVGHIDLLLLSLGHNEVIQENDFAREDYNDLTHLIRLTKEMKNEIIKENHLDENTEIPDCLITVGIRTVLNSKRIIICAKGNKCAKQIKFLASGESNKKISITSLLTHRDVRIYMDKDAAQLILND